MGATPGAMIQITSRSNPKIKQIRQLRHRKHREETGLFLVEGIYPVGQAVEATAFGAKGVKVDSIYFAPELLTSEYAKALLESQSQIGVPCYSTSPEVFETLADKENPQGILAVVKAPKRRLADYSPENFAWAVALVAPQDPGNIGTILRTIDAVGASGLILLDAGADPYHPGCVRASMGTIFWYPVIQATFTDFITWARRLGYAIYGTSARGSIDYQQIKSYAFPAILLMGSEQKGLSPEEIAHCDQLVRLPMQGKVSSLNLGVAAGVMLYHMLENIPNVKK
jgi:RNA methyltransferase, TrmH family